MIKKNKGQQSLAADGLFTLEAAGEFLGVSRTVVYGLIRRGELPSIKIGRRRQIPRRACEQFVDRKLASAS